jgi:hypothetical protein
MRVSQFIEQLNGLLEQYGDLEVCVLNGSELFTPEVGHSEQDYAGAFFSGDTWEERGITTPVFIIEGCEVMEFPEELIDSEDDE